MAPPDARGPLEGLVGPFLRFIWTFLGDILVVGRVGFTVGYLFTRLHVFFSDDVLRRNQIIKEVVLVEASSILPLPRRSESYWDTFS